MPFLIITINKNTFIFNALFIIVLLYLGIDFYIGTFYFGVLLARYHDALGAYLKKAPRIAVFLLLIAAILLYTCRYTFDMGNTPATERSQFRLYLSTAGSCLFILLALHSNFSRLLKNHVCLFWGNISYSFYLIHLPVLITVASLFPYKSNYSLIPILLISLSSAWLVSFIMYKCIELPFQRLAAHLSKRFRFFSSIKFR